MSVSPGELYAALGMDNEVIIVDPSSDMVVLGPLKGHPKTVRSITFSPDADHLLASYVDPQDALVVGWDTRTGNTTIGPLRLQGHAKLITCLSISPSCAQVATGSNDKSIRLWDAKNGQLLQPIYTKSQVVAIAFSPNGAQATAICDGTLQMWNAYTGDITLDPLPSRLQST